MERLLFFLVCAAAYNGAALANLLPAGFEHCIYDVDAGESSAAVFMDDGIGIVLERRIPINLPSLPKSTLLALIDIAVSSEPPKFTEVERYGMDATLHATMPENSTSIQETWIATRYRIYSRLAPLLFDALSLGSLSVSQRSNESVLLLPVPLCNGRETEALQQLLLSVIPGSPSDIKDKWIMERLDACTSLQTSEVFLFMSTGLLSIFMVFITLPFTIVTVSSCSFCKKGKQKIDIELYLKALSLISGTLIGAFLLYWVWVGVYYYTKDTIADRLFPGLAIVPFSINLTFYTLSGVVSFIGGMFFCKCSTLGVELSRSSPCHRLETGVLSLTLSAGVYHFLFVVVALLRDAVTVTSYLVVFGTVLMLLFLGICSIIRQYRKTQFKAAFGLVLTLKIIIFVLYIVLVKAFGSVLLEEDSYTATPAWLLVVTLLSLAVVSFAMSVFFLIQKQAPLPEERSHPPTISSDTTPPSRDPELGLTQNQVGLTPQTGALALKLPRDFLLIIPSVVNTWRRRELVNQREGRDEGRAKKSSTAGKK